MKDLLYAHCLGALALATVASSACGMTLPTPSASWCQVENGAKLPAASGGGAALCEAIERAATLRGVGGAFSVRVVAGSRSLLTANVILDDGRRLPALQMAEMDRPIGKTTFKRFADAVANHVAGAGR